MIHQSALLKDIHQRHTARKMRLWAKGLSTSDLVVAHKAVVAEERVRQPKVVEPLPFLVEEIEATRSKWRVIALDVCEKHGFTFLAMISDSRRAPLVRCRQEAMYRIYDKTTMSLPQIGRKLGDRDHTTIWSGIRRHAALHGLPLPRTNQPVEIPRFIGVPLSGECRA